MITADTVALTAQWFPSLNRGERDGQKDRRRGKEREIKRQNIVVGSSEWTDSLNLQYSHKPQTHCQSVCFFQSLEIYGHRIFLMQSALRSLKELVTRK